MKRYTPIVGWVTDKMYYEARDQVEQAAAVFEANPTQATRKAFSDMEGIWVRAARHRHPEKWRSEILKHTSDDAVRLNLACVIWWDWFGQRLVSNRWLHLDDLVARYHSRFTPRIDVSKLLIKLGYPTHRAQERGTRKMNGDWRSWSQVKEEPAVTEATEEIVDEREALFA